VGVHVEEAARPRQIARVELGITARRDRAERHDALAADADVGPHAGSAGAVVDRGAPNHEVVPLYCRHSRSGARASAPSPPARSPSAGGTMNSSIVSTTAGART